MLHNSCRKSSLLFQNIDRNVMHPILIRIPNTCDYFKFLLKLRENQNDMGRQREKESKTLSQSDTIVTQTMFIIYKIAFATSLNIFPYVTPCFYCHSAYKRGRMDLKTSLSNQKDLQTYSEMQSAQELQHSLIGL